MKPEAEKPKKKMGRPKKFADRDGSPQLTTRLDPPVYERIKKHPEGIRPYIERLVTEDAERTGGTMGVLPADQETQSGSE